MNIEELWSHQAVELISQRLRKGQRFLGAVNSAGDIELVFELGDADSFNLVTIESSGRVFVGFVANPEGYVE